MFVSFRLSIPIIYIGLVGYNQQFPNGMILYKSSIVSNKPVISYLNIYNKVDRYGIEDLVEEENNEINGITKINGEFNTDAESAALYNYLKVKLLIKKNCESNLLYKCNSALVS